MMVVIYWHCRLGKTWFDGWTMPIFFIIMGLFYHQRDSLKALISTKFQQLIIPFVIFSLPGLLISLCNEGFFPTMMQVVNPYRCLNGPSWFLIAMFWCYIIYWILNKITGERKWLRALTICVISFIAYYSSHLHIADHRIVLPFFFTTSLVCLVFIEAGALLHNCLIPNGYITRGGVKHLLCLQCCM